MAIQYYLNNTVNIAARLLLSSVLNPELLRNRRSNLIRIQTLAFDARRLDDIIGQGAKIGFLL